MASVLVAGAGVYGVSAAIALAKRGHRVTLVDPGPLPHPDAASTDISKAIRMDYGSDDFYMSLMESAFASWHVWNAEAPRPFYHEDGFLLLSRGPMASGGFEHESFVRLVKRGYAPERMDPKTLRARFPAWNAERYPDGYLNPRAGWAESGTVVAWLLDRAKDLGVSLREGLRIEEFLEDGARVVGVRVAGGARIHADFTVAALGAWTPVFLPHLADRLDVVGQPVLHFLPEDPSLFHPSKFPVWAADISNSGWYGFPALPDGRVKVANHGPGRRLHPGEPRRIAPGDEERFRVFLRESLPSLAGAPVVGSRLCLYCDSWDGNFYLDHDPDRPGLLVSTGGSGHGFKFAPVLGEVLADVLEGKANPYAHRFAWRARGRIAREDARHTGGEA